MVVLRLILYWSGRKSRPTALDAIEAEEDEEYLEYLEAQYANYLLDEELSYSE